MPLVYTNISGSMRTSQKTHLVFITHTNQLSLFKALSTFVVTTLRNMTKNVKFYNVTEGGTYVYHWDVNIKLIAQQLAVFPPNFNFYYHRHQTS